MEKHRSYIILNQICYDVFADEHHKYNNTNLVWKKLASMLTNELKKRNNKNGYRILEIGPGTGAFLSALNNGHNILYGVELSPRMAYYTQINCPNAIIKMGNVLDIKNINEFFGIEKKFDAITMAALIHLFPESDAIELLNKCKEWLEPNGLIYIDTTKENEFIDGEISEKRGSNGIKANRLRTRWTEDLFDKLLSSSGFKTINPAKTREHTDNKNKIWLRRIIVDKQ